MTKKTQIVSRNNKANKDADFLDLLEQNISDVLWILKCPEKQFTYCSPSVQKLRGYAVDEVLNQKPEDWFPPASLEKLEQFIEAAVSATGPIGQRSHIFIEELEVICKDQSTVWTELACTVVRNPQGKVVEVIGASRDITKRRVAEAARRESEEKYRALVEKGNDGIVIIEQGLIRFINPIIADLLGHSVEEMKDQPFTKYIAPEALQKVQNYYVRRMSGEDVPPIYETVLLDSSGNRKPVEFNSSIITYKGGFATQTFVRDISQRLLTEEKLRESEERYSLAVEGLNDGIFDWDLRTGRVYFSARYKAILGFEDSEFPNALSEWKNRIHPDDLEMAMKANTDYIEGNTDRMEVEYRMMHKDGSYRWILGRGVCLRDTNGKAYRMAGSHIDRTEHKKVETALIESENKFREITELLPQVVYEIDPQGNILFLNSIGLKTFEIDPEEITKHIDTKMFFIPEDRERLVENIKITLETLDSSRVNEYTCLRRDGSTFPVLIYGGPIMRDGKVCGVRGTMVDITERKLYEEALRKANERLKLHFQQTPLGYIEWNEKLEVADWNPAAENLFGYSRDEALHSHAFKLIVPENVRPHVEKVVNEILNQTGGSFSLNENVTKDGRIIICEWYNTPLKDHNGKVVGLASLIQDVTERKMLQAEMEKSHAQLKLNYSETLEQVQSYSEELKLKETELLKLQKDHLQSQFDTLKNQVNPHFLFNSLNVLSSLISADPDLAEKFTGELSKIYRYVLEHRSEDLVELSTELDFLNSYVFLLNIRFANKLNVNIDLPEEKLSLKLPPLAMQLLIENAIKHNTFSIKSPLVIAVFIDDENYLNVINNYQKRENEIQTTGLGIKNISDRLSYFTDKTGEFGIKGSQFVARIPLL